MGYFLCCIKHAKDDHTLRVLTNLTTKSWYAHPLDTLYRDGVNNYGFTAQLDTMYQVGVHKPHYAHQLDKLYRVEL